MLVADSPKSAHVVVIGNEKGGSGKSTISMHVAVALMKAGQRVATIDLDSRQQSLTHYIDNRRSWAARTRARLELPTHYHIPRAESAKVEANELAEFNAFNVAISAAEHTHDFVIIDTPGTDNYLMRLAHSLADILVTPLNDSFVDFDVLGTVDPQTFGFTGVSHYAETVREARRQRRLVDGALTDWIVAAQPADRARLTQQADDGRQPRRARPSTGVPPRRRICRARRLPRILSARPHRARRARCGDARQ